MKYNLYKVFFVLVLVLVLIDKVNASFICANGKVENIEEVSDAAPAKFTAPMPICSSKTLTGFETVVIASDIGVEEGQVQDYSNKDWVETIGDIFVKIWINATDNKSRIPKDVPICSDPAAKIGVDLECYWWESADKVKGDCGAWKEIIDEDCVQKYSNVILNNGLIENPNIENMKADSLIPPQCVKKECRWYHYVCPEGFDEEDDGWGGSLCWKKHTFNYSTSIKKGADEVDLTPIRDACKEQNGGQYCSCSPQNVKYSFKCPTYQCNKNNEVVDICTPDFKTSSGEDVYCVNPGQPFSQTYIKNSDYIRDTEFNVKECESSFSTVDCGYSNILIEGTYYNLDKKVIELALRLWGVHTQQTGFNGLGISNRIGSDCTSSVFFMREDGYSGRIINPYVETYNYFQKEILSDLRKNSEINPKKDINSFSIGCNTNVLGVACGNSTEYKQALALLANTILGNDNMQEHLKELFNDEINEDVRKANLTTNEKGDQYIDIYFDELKDKYIESKVKIDCNNLDKMVKDGNINQKQREQIEPYCNVKAVFVDANGNELKSLGGGTPAYCYKDYCAVKVEKFAICDIEKEVTTPIKARVTYNKSKSSESIGKYISCSNPNDNQILFGFDKDLISNTDKNSPGETINYEPVSEDFSITNYKCAGKCDDYSLRGEIVENCTDDNNNYNNVYKSSVKDPSLKCILNMGSPAIKNMYDYSDEFGVNTNLCRIYCSDEIEYYIADKVKAKSGEYFYYDIEKNVSANNNIQYLFSNIVKEKRTCVSEIYYNNNFVEDINWKKKYNLGKKLLNGVVISDDGISEEEIKDITNLKKLIKVMIKKAKKEGGRQDNINKLIYDLYNCNLYSKSKINNSGIYLETDKNNYVRDNINKKFSSSENYGIGRGKNCTINGNTNTCVTMKDVNYEFGSGPDGKKASMKSITTSTNTLDNLKYCSGPLCFNYSEEEKNKEYDYPTGTNSSNTKLDIKFNKSGKIVDATNDGIVIPTNDYVSFEIETDISFYNASRYYVKPSGEVITSNNSNESYLKLNAFTYPVYKNAFNLPICTERDFLGNENRCIITQQYDKIRTYFRNNPSDEFSLKANLQNRFTCYVDVLKPTVIDSSSKNKSLTDSTLFRNVDVSNIFPSSKDGYTTNSGSNWDTSNGRHVTDSILNSSSDLTTTNDYLEYRITLSPNQIKNIKEYNKDNDDDYINEEQQKCQIIGDTYQNCISPFMEELRKDDSYGTIDDNYNHGMSNYKTTKGKGY